MAGQSPQSVVTAVHAHAPEMQSQCPSVQATASVKLQVCPALQGLVASCRLQVEVVPEPPVALVAVPPVGPVGPLPPVRPTALPPVTARPPLAVTPPVCAAPPGKTMTLPESPPAARAPAAPLPAVAGGGGLLPDGPLQLAIRAKPTTLQAFSRTVADRALMVVGGSVGLRRPIAADVSPRSCRPAPRTVAA